jgi:hypothetical protein
MTERDSPESFWEKLPESTRKAIEATNMKWKLMKGGLDTDEAEHVVQILLGDTPDHDHNH